MSPSRRDILQVPAALRNRACVGYSREGKGLESPQTFLSSQGWLLFGAAEEAPGDSRGCMLPCKPGEMLASGVAADPTPDSSDTLASVKY